MAEAMGVSLKTEQRRSHSIVSSFRPWVRRAEGYWETRHPRPCWQVPVRPRRPPSLPLICGVFSEHSSFSVFRETPMAFFCDYSKKPNCYLKGSFRGNIAGCHRKGQQERGEKAKPLGGSRKRNLELCSFADLAFERDACAVLMKD
jgi:hypothetical protein